MKKIIAGENMLHIILGILKIIGFLLLLIFLLLLLIVLTVLFVPIRYQVLGDLHEDIFIEGKVTWLLRLVSLVVSFRDRKLEYSVKVFGIHVVKSESSDRTKTSAKNIKSGTKKDEAFSEEDEGIEPEILMNEEVQVSTEPPKKKEKIQNQTKPEQVENVEKEVPVLEEIPVQADLKKEAIKQGHVKEASPKQSVGEKIRKIIQKIKDVIEAIKDKIRNIHQTIENLKKKAAKVKKFLDAKETKNTLHHLKCEIFYLLRHIRPRKLEGNLRLGLDDPGSTGQILGYLSIIQGITGNHLQVEGVFEKKVTEGNVFLKGHIRLCHFIKILLSLLFDKNVRITIKRLLKMRG